MAALGADGPSRLCPVSAPGWYPDPGGQHGHFRYWDGAAWSPTTTTDPSQGPPGTNPLGTAPGGPGGSGSPGRRKTPIGLLIAAVVGIVLIAVVVTLGVRAIGDRITGGGTPGGQPTSEVCPTEDTTAESPAAQPGDGRVHGGVLSYPELPAPWSAPEREYRIPFGRDVLRQDIVIEQDPDWLAGVFVGELLSGDGFFGPEQGSEIVMKCVSGTFYGEGEVTYEVDRNEALTVDGHDAWVVEADFHFDVSGVDAKSERVIIVIISTGEGAAGLFFASIPENAMEHEAAARKAMDGLAVDK